MPPKILPKLTSNSVPTSDNALIPQKRTAPAPVGRKLKLGKCTSCVADRQKCEYQEGAKICNRCYTKRKSCLIRLPDSRQNHRYYPPQLHNPYPSQLNNSDTTVESTHLNRGVDATVASSGTLYSPPVFWRTDSAERFADLNAVENAQYIWKIPTSWDDIRRARVDEVHEMDWSAVIIDRSGRGGIQTNVVEKPSTNDQLHSEHEGSMCWGLHDSPTVSSPSPSNFRWYDLLGTLQVIGPSNVLKYLSNTEVLQHFRLVSPVTRWISESHIMKEIAKSYITLETEVNCLGFKELEWEHCHPSAIPTRFICGEPILFTAEVQPDGQQTRRRRLHRPGEFSPCTITFQVPARQSTQNIYEWHVDPVEHERARDMKPTFDSRQSSLTNDLIVFHNFSSRKFRDSHAKVYYKVEGEGPDVTLFGVSIQLRCLIRMMFELDSRR